MWVCLGMHTLTDDLWRFAVHQELSLGELLHCADMCTSVTT